ncbi:MAG: minor capsid protein [Candidatus Pararuminococcus gallinarum]|jgi:SPP1 gp7 family putative phage head morphogenesis protein
MSYWTRRQEQLKQTAEKDEAKLKKRLSSFFDAEFKRLEREIAAYYQTYGANNVIEYRRLLESLSDEDRRLLIERMDEFVRKYPQYADLMPVRETIYRLNRLEGLQYSVFMEEANIAGYTSEQMTTYLTGLSQKGVNMAMETLGFGKSFYAINAAVVKQFVDAPWCNGENFSTRIWNDSRKLAQYLNQDIAQGFARGDSYDKLVRQLRKRFSNVNRRDAYRLIFTEGTYVMAESSMQPFTEDFERYRLSPVMDGRTCPICRSLARQVFEIKDRQPGVNFPPIHPWCRCSWEIVVDDWDRWIDDYVAKHSGETKRAETVARRVDSEYNQDIGLSTFKTNKAYIGENGKFDIEAAKADYEKFIGATPENIQSALRYAFDTTPFVETAGKNIVFAYSPRKESILYNPKADNFNDYRFEIVATHEFGHRIDDMFKFTNNNETLTSAINVAAQIMEKKRSQFIDYSWENDEDGFISDIFSAIDKSDIFMAGHPPVYWQKPGNREAEIYANLFSLEAVGDKKKIQYLRENFPEIMQEYDKIEFEV